MANRLAQETSPYLLQHADNPVDWMAWGPAALARAQAENKPILLSVGYAACHWCHVMAHECFENPDIAALMNARFVNIKVDREERPDIDTIYQTALAMMGQQGGWPLTMFLTPDGKPFWGGTYFPPVDAHGRPGFPTVLKAIADTYAGEPDRVAHNVNALAGGLATLSQNQTGGPFELKVLDDIALRFAREFDLTHGGIAGAPKFPQCPILALLWRAWRRRGENLTGPRDCVLVTLTRMCQGGIYDHLGGGFARYSTDAAWLVPHFEKMLYDNAQLLELLAHAWQDTRDPLYAARAAETVDWLIREMIAANGAFAATLDADSEGEEGKFYVWTEAEIDTALADAGLADHAAELKRVYGVTAGGNWEGKTILTRGLAPGLEDPDTEARLAEARAALLARRARRVRPGWDDKVLADWNGLMIAALAQAGLAFDRPDWVGLARSAFDAVLRDLVVDGRLQHAWRLGRTTAVGLLDDHAAMARAALALFEATGDAACLTTARDLAAAANRHFWDTTDGGYFFTADDAEALIVRTKSAHDAATPSGNAMMLEVLARLFVLTGDSAYARRAQDLATAFAGELARNFFPLATYLNAVELMASAVIVVVVGDGPAAEDLARAVLDLSLPNRVFLLVPDAAALPPGHPAAGKGPVDGRPAAYLCRGMTCQPPITEAAALRAALAPEAEPA
ncbi:MAG: thioredoxin domain-containing protein [Rhodospirillaceae bacterium]|nr:thioredoxin domain-containing protein [Rhodospirillaceae bacterium]